MKKIYLIRHAKSSWKEKGMEDFDRPLNGRGKRDAILMGKRLKLFDVMPDIIFSSPAKRAFRTARELAYAIDFDKKKIIQDETLYESSHEKYLTLIHQIDDTCNAVFIIAHNPEITEVGEILSGAILSNIPTCAIVCIEFDVQSFKEIGEDSGKVLFFDYPKKHIKE